MFNLSSEQNIQEIYLPSISSRIRVLYWTLLLFVIAALVSLPLIKVDISVRSNGIIRPAQERTELKSPVSAIIDEIYFTDGSAVHKGDVLFRFRNDNAPVQNLLQQQEINQRQLFIHDLQILTSQSNFSEAILSQLQSPLFRQQANRYLYQLSEKKSLLNKSSREYQDNDLLYKSKVISEYELIDKRTEYDRQTASLSSFKNEQQSQWEQLLVQYKMELAGFSAQQQQLSNGNKSYEIIAPQNGTLRGINNKYKGNAVQAGEILGELSPDTTLIAECFVPSQDAGLLKQGQQVKFQVDAFDYKYFGSLTGEIIRIDNDVTTQENQILYKVRCKLNNTQLHLNNGYRGALKKGLTLQARFMITRRSLWQLLFDKLDDWLNPITAKK